MGLSSEPLRILLTANGATKDITSLVQSATWGGGYSQVARTLDFSMLSSPRDKALPVAPCELGGRVQFYLGNTLLFDGFVFSRQRDTGSDTVEVSAYDRGVYLKRNEAAYLFKGLTAEAITRRVCGDFNVAVGNLATTGTAIKRNFPGTSLYQIIQTAYTLASQKTGARYMVRFRGDALEVVAKKQGAETLVIQPGSNLINATVTESIENMVNQVAVYDDKGSQVGTYPDGENIKLYGLMQAYLKKSKDKDTAAEAKRILEDGDTEQKITVEVTGNPALKAGDCCVMREAVTGLYGLFWIDEDTHTWKNGLYQTKLVLNFRNIMDEQEAGSLPKA